MAKSKSLKIESKFVDDLKQRILSRITINSENNCWEWNRSSSKGYGYLSYKNVLTPATRISYAIFKRPIKSGELIRHMCDNPKCVNPVHLIPGTHRDNTMDMMKRKRHSSFRKTHCINGHLMDKENTRQLKLQKICIKCRLETQRKYREKLKIKMEKSNEQGS